MPFDFKDLINPNTTPTQAIPNNAPLKSMTIPLNPRKIHHVSKRDITCIPLSHYY